MRALVGLFLMTCTVSTAPAQVLGPTIWQADPSTWIMNFGYRFSVLSDVDGDGCRDVMIGSAQPPFSQTTPGVNGDEVRIVSGATGAIIHQWFSPVANVAAAHQWIVQPGAGLRDQDGDGVDDLFIYRTEYLSGGFANDTTEVRSGATGGLIATLPGNPFLWPRVKGVADYDGDGKGDVLQVYCPPPLCAFNEVRVVSSVTGQVLWQVTSPSGIATSDFGRSIAVAGDVDGDGWDDFIVGEPGSSSTFPLWLQGNVYIFSGNTGQILVQVTGQTATDSIGSQVAAAGDMDGDGVPDFATSTRTSSITDDRVRVYSGATGAVIYDVLPPSASISTIPLCVGEMAGGEDVDGDGVPDLVFAVPFAGYTPSVFGAGAVYVLSGASGQMSLLATGDSAPGYADGLGGRVGLIGDVTGDGLADIVASAPNQGSFNGYGTPGFVRAYAGQPWTSDGARAGNVNANGVGGVVDVLRVDAGMTGQPSAGQGTSRSLDLAVGLPFSLWMARPPAGPGIAPYVLWGEVSEALVFQAVTLPFGVGDMAITPPFLAPGDPTLFTLSDTFSYANQLLPAFPAVGQGNGIAVSSVTTGIPFPVTFTLQGVILDASSPVGVSVTNALRLHVD